MKNSSQLKLVLGIVTITAVAFTVMNIFKPTAPIEKLEDRVERLEAISAKMTDVFPTIRTQAVVESRLNIDIKSQVSGLVVYASPKFLSGGFFDTGEIILKIDPSDYQLALVQAEVNVARAEQDLSVEKEQAVQARQDWDKYGAGEASDLVLRIPQLREAEVALKGAIANYDTQKIQLDRTEVRAPFPLMIATKIVDLGQVVSNNQDLAAVFGTEEAEIRMPLSQKQVDLLNMKSVGILSQEDVLDVTIRDFSRDDNISWPAKILRVESTIDRRSRVYYAVATIYDPMNLKKDKDTPPLLPGVFVDLEVQGPKIGNVYKVPIKAMRDDTNIFIYDDEKLVTKKVVVIDRDKDFVTISTGLQENDNIVTSPPFSYVPGMKAQLTRLDGVTIGGVVRNSAAAPTQQANAANRPNSAEIANMTPEQRAAARARRQGNSPANTAATTATAQGEN